MNRNVVFWISISTIIVAIFVAFPHATRFPLFVILVAGAGIFYRFVLAARDKASWYKPAVGKLTALHFVYLAIACCVVAGIWIFLGITTAHTPRSLVFFTIFPATGIGIVAAFFVSLGYYIARTAKDRD